MAQLFDLAIARAILQSDPVWCAYALGDLDPAPALQCSWHWTPGDRRALAMIYRGLSPPILFITGPPDLAAPLISEIAIEPELSLHVQPDMIPLIQTRFRITGEKADWRMAIHPDDFRPASPAKTIRLEPADLGRVRSLYADGKESGESPDYFAAASMSGGVFFGIAEGDNLIAVAGTHLVSEREQVAALGNVYTRRDRRGLGLAARVTSAVVSTLAGKGIRTIALNVRQQNQPAIGVYERLGFRKHCEFREGIASRQ
ncbi:MAG: GNAT family N-acetyltransferase [Bryobacteraceae bacterium]